MTSRTNTGVSAASSEGIGGELGCSVGLLVWSGPARGCHIDEGVDSFLVADGRINAQTMHDLVRPD
jgi:hypothetical protein